MQCYVGEWSFLSVWWYAKRLSWHTVISADNLAAWNIGGYKAVPSAFRKCQYCMMVDKDIQTKVNTFFFQNTCIMTIVSYLPFCTVYRKCCPTVHKGTIQFSMWRPGHYMHLDFDCIAIQNSFKNLLHGHLSTLYNGQLSRSHLCVNYPD